MRRSSSITRIDRWRVHDGSSSGTRSNMKGGTRSDDGSLMETDRGEGSALRCSPTRRAGATGTEGMVAREEVLTDRRARFPDRSDLVASPGSLRRRGRTTHGVRDVRRRRTSSIARSVPPRGHRRTGGTCRARSPAAPTERPGPAPGVPLVRPRLVRTQHRRPSRHLASALLPRSRSRAPRDARRGRLDARSRGTICVDILIGGLPRTH